MVRHLRGRRSEAGFLAEVARDWSHLFPVLPHQGEANRRARWLWGAFEQVRVLLAARLPPCSPVPPPPSPRTPYCAFAWPTGPGINQPHNAPKALSGLI
jgi:hypothetical protein